MKRIKSFVRGKLLRFIGGFCRGTIAHQYLKGEGLEIGALHCPLEVPPGVCVKYVDRLPVSELRKHYPELGASPLVNVDIIDDGELLSSVANGSQDFVIANHFLEHCENPVLALTNMFRVLKEHGILYFALPDKRATFDSDRAETTMEHLWGDYVIGPAGSKKSHFKEWVEKVEKISNVEAARERIAYLMEMGYSIHFHTFTQNGMFKFLSLLKEWGGLLFEIQLCMSTGGEMIFVLKKSVEAER